MTLIVETGLGIYQANSYAGRGFVRTYLRTRNKATVWDAASEIEHEAALIGATDYIDRRFGRIFRGQKEFTDLSVPDFDILDIITNPTNNDTVTIGATVYTFSNTASAAFEVEIGATIIESAANLVAAINGTGGGAGTTAHPDVTARVLEQANYIMVEAIVTPLVAAIDTSSSDTNSAVWDLGTLSGGNESAEQQLEWPRLYAYSDAGVLLDGIPNKLREAVAEYANRALTETLMPDPVADETGQFVSRTFDKVGPIETEREYVAGSVMTIIKKFPEADRLLRDLIRAGGGVIR